MIITESIGDSIIIRGRDEHGERYERRINHFQPYFYVPRQNIVGETYYSLFGEKLQRITCVNQKDFRTTRKTFDLTYEGDVPPTIRYLIDNYYQKGIESEVIRVCFFDIETDGIPNITKADTMITSIAAYDNFRNLYYCFTVAPDGVVSKDKYTRKIQFDGNEVEARIFMFATEKEMLNKFLTFVQQLDFDLFLAWNGDRFDYPYLFNRMKALKINPRLLSPIKQMGKGYGDMVDKPRCRVWLDLMVCYKKLSTQEMESYSLDYISRKELGTGKIEHQEKFEDFWRNNLDKFIEYNIKDVYLMVKIEESKGIVKYFDTIRRFTFCSWYDVFYNSKVLDCFFLLKAKEYGIVLPTTRKQKDYTKITGAIVITPTVGVHQNVAVGDVRSLYPTAILTCNMSPETIVTNVTNCNNYVTVDDVYFSLDKRGFIPRVVEDLWNLRQEFKKKRDTFELGSHDYEMWDTIQTVCKFLLNSVYGVMLAPHFRLFTRDIGKSITYFGRRTNLWMQEKVKERKHDIIAGDSVSYDSMINVNGKFVKISDLFEQCDEISDEGKEYYFPKETWITDSMDDYGNHVAKPIKYVMRHKVNKKMYRLHFTNLWHVDVTEDHALYGFIKKHKQEQNKIMGLRKPDELHKVINGCDVRSLIQRKKTYREKIESMNYPKEMYEFIGYFIGNGSFSDRNRGKHYVLHIALGNDVDDIYSKIITPLIEQGYIKSCYPKNKKGDYNITGKLVKIMCKYVLTDTWKKIPDFMYTETEENIASFLRGLYSADGSISKRKSGYIIKFTTIHEWLAREVVNFFNYIGIASSIYKDNTENSYKGKFNGTFNYVVNIKDHGEYKDKVGFIQERKIERLNDNNSCRKYYKLDYNIAPVRRIEEIEYNDYVYDIEVEDTHRFFANNVLVHNTDSIIFTLKTDTLEDSIVKANDTIDYINNSLDYFCESEFGDSTYNKMFIEFEKIYSNVFFVGDEYDNAVKKRYAGLIVYKDGADISDHPKLEIKGFEAKRSDTPTVIRELQSNVFRMILTGKGKDEIFPLVKGIRDKIIAGEYTPYEIGIPKGVSKEFHEYTSNMPIHIHGAIYFNKYCNGNIKMEKMKYIYVKDVPPGLPKTHAISFTDEQPIPEGFIIDYARMAEKLVDEKFHYIFLSMGWNIHELDGVERFW